MRAFETKDTYIDIETGLGAYKQWSTGKTYLGTRNILLEPTILCAAWKDKDDTTIQYTDSLKYKKAPKDSILKWIPDDSQICKDIVEGLRNTDVAIAHNGDKFDIPWINGRCWVNGLPSIGSISTVDTYKLVKKNLRLQGYSLDYLRKLRGDSGKIKTSYEMWERIVFHKDMDVLQEMVDYNIEDVLILEEFHNDIKQIDTTIKRNQIDHPDAPCPFCGKKHKQLRGRIKNLKTWRRRMQCQGCGAFLISPLLKHGEVTDSQGVTWE